MSDRRYRVEILSDAHDRAAFSCGEDALDRYLREFAGQDVARGFAVVYVLVDVSTPTMIAGFYTLSASSIPLDTFPKKITRKLPKYPHVPVSLVGRRAIDRKYQGQHCGSHLVVDALWRSCTTSEQVIGIYAVVVEAKSKGVLPFYERLGFVQFQDNPLRLFIPIKTAREALRRLLPDAPRQAGI